MCAMMIFASLPVTGNHSFMVGEWAVTKDKRSGVGLIVVMACNNPFMPLQPLLATSCVMPEWVDFSFYVLYGMSNLVYFGAHPKKCCTLHRDETMPHHE